MKISKLITLVSLCLPALSFGQQTVKIYHGAPGRTEFLKGKNGVGADKTLKEHKGKTITLVVINPHPALYDYKFSVETIKEEPDKIDGSSGLIALLNGFMPSPSGGAGGARLLVGTGSWQDAYREKIEDFKKQLKDASDVIKKSDTPEGITDAVNGSAVSGFLWARSALSQIAFFADKDLDKTVAAWSASFKVAPFSYDPADPTEKLIMDAFDGYLLGLLKTAKEIKSAYREELSSTVTYTITVGDSVQMVYLTVKNKSEDLKARQIGDKLISLRIEPYFNRPVLEFIPLAGMSYTKEAFKFGVENNLVVKSKDESFKFFAGGMLNLNFKNFGARKEYSLGAGPGFAIVDGDLNTFYFNFLISYKKWVRIGLGAGYLSTPSYLKEGAMEGAALPANITDLNKVIGYERKGALFFSFVFPGLNLPLLK